jgi:phospholipid/cholesterol/gamma-HCH transport system substrate-binding protein
VTSRSKTRFPSENRYRVAAVVAGLGLVLATAFVFAKGSLFGGGYELRAMVASASQLRGGSEVRIAGVKVGEVESIEPGPRHTSTVTMTVDDEARPIRHDATLTVKPRLVLEGNAYIDLSPGSQGGRELPAGATIPLARTAITPQLDQVLNVLDAPTRGSLHAAVAELGGALGSPPPDRKSAVGSGFRGLRRAVHELDGALGSVRQVAAAAQGTRPLDLTRAVQGTGDTVAQLATDPRALADSVTGFNRVMGSLAREEHAVSATIAELDALLRRAPASLSRIDAALPELTLFGDALRPTLREAPAALASAGRTLDQIGAVTRPSELPRLLERLAPLSANLPDLERRLRALFGYTRQVTDCLTSNVVPALDSKIQDGPHTTGDPAWLDLLHAITGFTSASTSFDGNGGTFRAGLAFGPGPLRGVIPGMGTIAGNLNTKIQGIRPAWLGYGVEPPYRPDVPCKGQKLPDLNAEAAPPPDWNLRKATVRKKARAR